MVPPEFMYSVTPVAAVTTNSFQDPACPRQFLNQLQDTLTIQAFICAKPLAYRDSHAARARVGEGRVGGSATGLLGRRLF
jgi:hypothetical protein